MIEELEKIIIQNLRNIPQVPLSLLLSGGIDSSIILALLRKVYPQVPISTFTLAKSKDYPDIVYAREIAGLFGTEHHEVIISDQTYQNYLIEYQKTKQYSFNGDINVYILCSLAKTFSTNIVTGDGGDECFGGYWLHEHPLGHKEAGNIKSFEDIHPVPRKHLSEMVSMGFRDFLFKEKSQVEDYDAVWEYFVSCLAPKHLAPLLHTAKVLNIKVYTPFFSESFINFIKMLPICDRIGRNIEKQLASMYLPESVVERESIGFDIALQWKPPWTGHSCAEE